MALLFNGKQTINQPYQMNLDKLEEAYDAAHERAQLLLERGVDAHRVYDQLLLDIDLSRPPTHIVLGQVDGFITRRRQPLRKARPAPRLGALHEAGHRRGPDDARAVIHFFGSMQSKICAQQARNLEDVRKEFDGDLAIVFHDLYDPDDSGQPSAGLGHQLLRCAEEQGSYWEMWDQHYNQLMMRPGHARHITQEDMEAEARALAIDPARLVACMSDGRHERAVERDVAAARRAGVRLTPSIAIGGMLYEGSLSADSIRALVLDQLLPGVLEEWAPTR
jgi:protein-disulfide isomerase